ncbi:MAG: penicillin acylase family protein [Promethearchaeota archaeon]
MKKVDKKTTIKLSAVIILTVIVFTIFSIPLISLIAPLGNIILPGGGIWRVPGEVPQNEKLYIPGLDDSVTIYRDEWGIPHIYASTEEDLTFALGYVHAQDRLFQMDLARRNVRGKLSEVLGPIALEEDKFNLAMGMEYWANKTLQHAIQSQEEGDINFMDSLYTYADGVNYYISTHEDELPIEYAILGFKPTKWTPLDTFCFSKYMSKMLTWQYNDLYNLQALETLGEAKFTELFRSYSTYGQIPICPNYGSYNDSSALSYNGGPLHISSKLTNTISSFLSDVENIPLEKNLIEAREHDLIGSNNWVVDGNKSSTGKPILCNDMHLAWNMPGIWYEVHLVAEKTDYNVYGFTLAGVPIPIVANNEYLAWGFTNVGYDVMDWYFYDEVDSDHYIYNQKTTEYTTRTYNIKVKDQGSEKFTVKETVHGPVLNDFLGDRIPDSLDSEKIVLAPKWTANNITTEFRAIYGYCHAKNRAEFNEASPYFQNPAQNHVYADIYGNIAIRPTGLVPIRDDSMNPSWNFGNGSLPYNGSNGEGEWIGYVPFEELPNTINPSQHYLASANQIVVGPQYKNYTLQNSWATGYRARRINELLNNSADGTVGVEKMKEIQLDVKSTAARAFVPYLIDAIEMLPSDEKDAVIVNIETQLKNWNFDMDKDLAAPTIYRKWRDYYRDYTFNDDFEAAGTSSRPSLNVLEKLTRDDPNSKWFDDIETSTIENRTDIIIKALNSAIEFLLDFYGTDDVSTWRWGDIHKLLFPSLVPGFDSLTIGPFDGDGSGYTVNPAGANIEDGVGYALGGASERMIIDFSNLENSLSVIPSGERAIANSKHYSDQVENLFLKGKYHRRYFYGDIDDYPLDHIESTIKFAKGTTLVVPQYLPAVLILVFLVGILSVIVGLKKKDLILSKYRDLKRKVRGE